MRPALLTVSGLWLTACAPSTEPEVDMDMDMDMDTDDETMDAGTGGAAGRDGPVLTPAPDPVRTQADGATGSGNPVTFRYRPGWPGVNTVKVYGDFGQAKDWALPFLSLTPDGTGT